MNFRSFQPRIYITQTLERKRRLKSDKTRGVVCMYLYTCVLHPVFCERLHLGGGFVFARPEARRNKLFQHEKLLLFPIRFFPVKIKLTSLIRDLACAPLFAFRSSLYRPPPSLFPGFDLNPFQFVSRGWMLEWEEREIQV